MRNLNQRLAAIEAKTRNFNLVANVIWSPDDDAFFEYMFARALLEDRDWTHSDCERYHCLLLDEPWEAKL